MITHTSALVLILANTIPIIGVLTLGWDVLSILLLYWTESVIIGAINVIRMMKCSPENILVGLAPLQRGNSIPPEALAEVRSKIPSQVFNGLKFIIIPFFIVHYGGFCFGHLMAVIGFFSDAEIEGIFGNSLQYFWQTEYWIAVVAIAGSHLFSYFNNYVGKGEYKKANLMLLMQRPYGRIFVMQLTIIFGAGLVMWLGDPLPLIIVLVLAKTVIDYQMHIKERNKFADHRVGSVHYQQSDGPINV